MDDLVTWLRDQLDDDERVAREASPARWRLDAAPDGRWYISPGPDVDDVGEATRRADADHIARHDPARVLAEVDARRRILDLHADLHECPEWDRPLGETCTGYYGAEGCPTVRLLALPYADRPGYRDEWKP